MIVELDEPSITPQTLDDSYSRINSNARLAREGLENIVITGSYTPTAVYEENRPDGLADPNTRLYEVFVLLKSGGVFEANDRLFKIQGDMTIVAQVRHSTSHYIRLNANDSFEFTDDKGAFDPIKNAYYQDTGERVLSYVIEIGFGELLIRSLRSNHFTFGARTTLFKSALGARRGTCLHNFMLFDALEVTMLGENSQTNTDSYILNTRYTKKNLSERRQYFKKNINVASGQVKHMFIYPFDSSPSALKEFYIAYSAQGTMTDTEAYQKDGNEPNHYIPSEYLIYEIVGLRNDV